MRSGFVSTSSTRDKISNPLRLDSIDVTEMRGYFGLFNRQQFLDDLLNEIR